MRNQRLLHLPGSFHSIADKAIKLVTQHHFNTTGKGPESSLLVYDSMFKEWLES